MNKILKKDKVMYGVVIDIKQIVKIRRGLLLIGNLGSPQLSA